MLLQEDDVRSENHLFPGLRVNMVPAMRTQDCSLVKAGTYIYCSQTFQMVPTYVKVV